MENGVFYNAIIHDEKMLEDKGAKFSFDTSGELYEFLDFCFSNAPEEGRYVEIFQVPTRNEEKDEE